MELWAELNHRPIFPLLLLQILTLGNNDGVFQIQVLHTYIHVWDKQQFLALRQIAAVNL